MNASALVLRLRDLLQDDLDCSDALDVLQKAALAKESRRDSDDSEDGGSSD